MIKPKTKRSSIKGMFGQKFLNGMQYSEILCVGQDNLRSIALLDNYEPQTAIISSSLILPLCKRHYPELIYNGSDFTRIPTGSQNNSLTRYVN